MVGFQLLHARFCVSPKSSFCWGQQLFFWGGGDVVGKSLPPQQVCLGDQGVLIEFSRYSGKGPGQRHGSPTAHPPRSWSLQTSFQAIAGSSSFFHSVFLKRGAHVLPHTLTITHVSIQCNLFFIKISERQIYRPILPLARFSSYFLSLLRSSFEGPLPRLALPPPPWPGRLFTPSELVPLSPLGEIFLIFQAEVPTPCRVLVSI